MKNIKYEQLEDNVFGLHNKESVKLFTLMEEEVEHQYSVFYNMLKFRENICG